MAKNVGTALGLPTSVGPPEASAQEAASIYLEAAGDIAEAWQPLLGSYCENAPLPLFHQSLGVNANSIGNNGSSSLRGATIRSERALLADQFGLEYALFDDSLNLWEEAFAAFEQSSALANSLSQALLLGDGSENEILSAFEDSIQVADVSIRAAYRGFEDAFDLLADGVPGTVSLDNGELLFDSLQQAYDGFLETLLAVESAEIARDARSINSNPSTNGDYNNDGFVSGADYVFWRDGGSLDDTAAGYEDWADNFGAGTPATINTVTVPEPAAALLLLAATLPLVASRSSRA